MMYHGCPISAMGLKISSIMFGLLSISIIQDVQGDLVSLMLSDPEGERKMTTSEIIAFHGYPVEDHSVTTEDGYILEMQRIPHGKSGPGSTPKPPVIIQHGLLCSSTIWVWNTPDRNLAYVLADAGYDVWLTNTRGNEYGRNHTSLSPSNLRFWAFSWDEMAKFDIPAMIDYVLRITNAKELDYIGHSMGTTMIFVLLSTKPEYNAKIKGVHALAPVTQLKYTKSPIKALAVTNLLPSVAALLLSNGEFQLNGPVLQLLTEAACGVESCTASCNERCTACLGLAFGCQSALFLLSGPDFHQMNQSRVDLYLRYLPTSTSVRTVHHYIQFMGNTRFRQYDYGIVGNLLYYNQISPPSYNLTKVTAPVYLYYGENDWLTDPRDVAKLPPQLQNLKGYLKISDPSFSHGDFIWSIDGPKLVYDHVLANMRSIAATLQE